MTPAAALEWAIDHAEKMASVTRNAEMVRAEMLARIQALREAREMIRANDNKGR